MLNSVFLLKYAVVAFQYILIFKCLIPKYINNAMLYSM